MDNQEQKIASPPALSARIRTMESDIKAIQEGGGEISWVEAGEEKELKPASSAAAFEQLEETVQQPEESLPTQKSFKSIFLIIFGLMIIVGLGFILGNRFIFPLFGSPQEKAGLINPPSSSQTAFILHESFFIVSPDKTEEIKLATVNLISIKNALEAFSRDGLPTNAFKEVVFLLGSAPIDFQSFIKELLPDFPLKAADFFEKDFTAFLYYDEKGVWPGYIVKLKPSVIVITAQTQIKQIEASNNLRNFFIQPIGSSNAQGFQSGQLNGKPIRYLNFPKADANLSYGWFTNFIDSSPNHYLVISASDGGLEEALKRLIQ